MKLFSGLLVIASFIVHVCFAAPTEYNVGAGIADVTGPAAGINMVNTLRSVPHNTHIELSIQ